MSMKENNSITEIDSDSAAPETEKKPAETLTKADPAIPDSSVTGSEGSSAESKPAKSAGKKSRKTVKKSGTAKTDGTVSADTEPAAPAKKKRNARKSKADASADDASGAKKTAGRKKKESARKTAEKADASKPSASRSSKPAAESSVSKADAAAEEVKKEILKDSAPENNTVPAVTEPKETDKAPELQESSPAAAETKKETPVQEPSESAKEPELTKPARASENPEPSGKSSAVSAVSKETDSPRASEASEVLNPSESIKTEEPSKASDSIRKTEEQNASAEEAAAGPSVTAPSENKTEADQKKEPETKKAEEKPAEPLTETPVKKEEAVSADQRGDSSPSRPENTSMAPSASAVKPSSSSNPRVHHVISVSEANRRNAEEAKKEAKKETKKEPNKEVRKETEKEAEKDAVRETKPETKQPVLPAVISPKQKLNFGLAGKIMLGLFALVLVLAVAAGFGGFMFYQSLLENMPPLDISKREQYSQASKIYDKDGVFVAEYGTNENVEWADSDEIPQMLKDAFIAIEDERFYTHNGIDLKRLTGAVIGQITGNSSYGASTITQQLIKNTHLSQEVSYTRKAQEIHLAMKLEEVMTKDEILVWYMNTLYLGDSNYGVKVAAKDYFGKELKELSLRECAILAGLAQSPNEYNPRLNMLKGDIAPTNKRIANVLYKMLETGKISEEQYTAALNSHLSVLRNSRRYKLYDYPIYVEYAVENVASKLLSAEGKEINDDTLNEKKQWLRGAGYNIYTAFDRHIQDVSQEAIQNFDKYPSTVTGTQVEVSTVIMDQRKGTVVAMVGGREEAKEPEGFNRATDSTQAVGSSIKPLSVYAPACETGDYPGTTVLDVQSSIEGYGEDNSYPNGDHTGGAITMRKALELSHNIPAARFLLEHVGIDRSYDFMVEEGFAVENLAKTPAGLALGATDVTTLEMTAAYACLANGGVYIEPHAYTKVTDRFGTVILDATKEIESHTVFSKSTAWLVTDMMESNMREGYGVNARLTDVPSAGKTGTHEHQVISFGGYSPYYTSFLRISADDYVRMINSSSYYQSAALWKAYMDPIHEGLESREIQDFTKEDVGIQEYYVCDNSGKLAESWCSGHNEYAAPGNAPTEKCDGHTYGTGQSDWSEWDQESSYNYSSSSEPAINYDDPEWWLHGWWDEQGNFHPQ